MRKSALKQALSLTIILMLLAPACSTPAKESNMNYEQAQRIGQEHEKDLNQLFTGALHGHTDSLDPGGPLPCTDSSDPKKQTTVLYTRGFIVTGLDPDFAVTRKAFVDHWAEQGWHEDESDKDARRVKMKSTDGFFIRLMARPQTGEAVYEVRSPCVPNPHLGSD